MRPLARALALGLIQGPVELAPVSSSAHITLLPWLAGCSQEGTDAELAKSLQVALHIGTAAALSVVLRRDLARSLARLGGRAPALLCLATLPPALAGYAFERPIERRIDSPAPIAAGLVIGALAMALADRRPIEGRTLEQAGAADGLALGLAQALALAPGVSRRGATLAAARGRGFGRRDAHALSWAVSLPVIVAASTLKGVRLAARPLPRGARVSMAAGAGASLLSTAPLARLARGHRRSPGPLAPYALYRVALASLVLVRLRRDRS
jgi:undecaprenyl-diphosphatase